MDGVAVRVAFRQVGTGMCGRVAGLACHTATFPTIRQGSIHGRQLNTDARVIDRGLPSQQPAIKYRYCRDDAMPSLREVRANNLFSIRELGRLAGVASSTIYLIESGRTIPRL